MIILLILKIAVQFFNLFPKSLGQLLHKYQVDELHLTFTQGRWMYERWGMFKINK